MMSREVQKEETIDDILKEFVALWDLVYDIEFPYDKVQQNDEFRESLTSTLQRMLDAKNHSISTLIKIHQKFCDANTVRLSNSPSNS
jgi:hypothetical protein